MIGMILGRYQVTELIGRGGMASVYKAYHPDLDRYVAIKVLHANLTQREEFVKRFRREAQSIARLRHPNIVQLHDFDTQDDITYMVMELIPGPSLKDRLHALEQKGEWVSLEEAVRIVREVGTALDYAHQQGLVHRDVKPANIMFGEDGSAILTDFGIVKIFGGEEGARLTASGMLLGTPAYMAPEQVMGVSDDPRSDIYALGVVLYQLVTRQLPFKADTPMAVAFQHLNAPLPRPRTLNPAFPEGVERVILRALAKEPGDRYQSVRTMLEDLDQAMRGGYIPQVDPAITTVKWQPSPPPPKSRRRWLWGVGGLGVVVALLLVGYAFMGRGRPTAPFTPTTPAVVPVVASASDTPAPSWTPVPSPSSSSTPTPSLTPVPSPSSTSTPTDTPIPSATPTLTPKPSPSDTPTPSTVPTPTFGVGSEAVALRNAYVFPTTDSNSTPLTLVHAGESVIVQAHYGDWLQVRTDGNVTGWVYQPGWFEIAGDISVLPTAIPPQLALSTSTVASTCAGGELTLTLYSDPGSEQCVPGGRWSVNLHFIAHGGNCVYTFFWEGLSVAGPTTANEYIYTVTWGNAALVGTGAVESGGVTVRQELFVPKPSWCP